MSVESCPVTWKVESCPACGGRVSEEMWHGHTCIEGDDGCGWNDVCDPLHARIRELEDEVTSLRGSMHIGMETRDLLLARIREVEDENERLEASIENSAHWSGATRDSLDEAEARIRELEDAIKRHQDAVMKADEDDDGVARERMTATANLDLWEATGFLDLSDL